MTNATPIPDEELDRWEQETGEHRDSYPLDEYNQPREILDACCGGRTWGPPVRCKREEK